MADKLDDKEILALIDNEFQNSMGIEGGEISEERAKAWKYYLSKEFGNEVEGQSSVVTSDVSDVVDGIMPSLLRLFTTADNLVSFDAVGPEDEAQAEQASDYVNHVFFKENPAFSILYTWFFDALVQKNGIVKAWYDDSEKVTRESYQGLTTEEFLELLEDEELEAVERSEEESVLIAEDGSEIPYTTHDVVFKRKNKKGKIKVENVPPEQYRISNDARGLDPSCARFVGQERDDVTRAELIEMGFDAAIVDDLPAEGNRVYSSSEQISRRDKTDETGENSGDRSQDLITLREAYVHVDVDGTGRAELRQIYTAGNEVLSNEPVDRQPFHVICPQPLPHKHFGRATAEKVMDVQLTNSTILRQTLMNLYHTNNPGHGVWEQGIGEHTLDDLLSTQVGGTKRFARPPQESYMPITVPFTAGASFPMMEYWDKVKRDRTGIAADSEGLDPEQLKNIQTTVMSQANDLSKMKVEAVARIFAETGIKSLMLHIHELVLKHQQKEQIVKLRNEWVAVDPREWRERENVTVNIGLGIGSREQNLLHLNAIWEKQREIAMATGMNSIVQPQNIYNTCAEIVKNANLKQPEMFFTKVDEIPQQPDPQAELVAKQQQLEQQDQALKAAKLELDKQKTALEHERGMLEIQRKSEADDMDYDAKMEQNANDLTKLEVESNRNIPGANI